MIDGYLAAFMALHEVCYVLMGTDTEAEAEAEKVVVPLLI